jgi:hypothetical protein
MIKMVSHIDLNYHNLHQHLHKYLYLSSSIKKGPPIQHLLKYYRSIFKILSCTKSPEHKKAYGPCGAAYGFFLLNNEKKSFPFYSTDSH